MLLNREARTGTVKRHDDIDSFSAFHSAHAVQALIASHDDHHGNVVVDTHAGHLTLQGVSLTQLASHSSDFLFV